MPLNWGTASLKGMMTDFSQVTVGGLETGWCVTSLGVKVENGVGDIFPKLPIFKNSI